MHVTTKSRFLTSLCIIYASILPSAAFENFHVSPKTITVDAAATITISWVTDPKDGPTMGLQVSNPGGATQSPLTSIPLSSHSTAVVILPPVTTTGHLVLFAMGDVNSSGVTKSNTVTVVEPAPSVNSSSQSSASTNSGTQETSISTSSSNSSISPSLSPGTSSNDTAPPSAISSSGITALSSTDTTPSTSIGTQPPSGSSSFQTTQTTSTIISATSPVYTNSSRTAEQASGTSSGFHPTSSARTKDDRGNKRMLSSGAIAGIVIGALFFFFFLLILLLSLIFCKNRLSYGWKKRFPSPMIQITRTQTSSVEPESSFAHLGVNANNLNSSTLHPKESMAFGTANESHTTSISVSEIGHAVDPEMPPTYPTSDASSFADRDSDEKTHSGIAHLGNGLYQEESEELEEHRKRMRDLIEMLKERRGSEASMTMKRANVRFDVDNSRESTLEGS